MPEGHADSDGLDSEETGIKGQHDQNPYCKTVEAEIPWIRILQGQQGKRVEVQTASGIGKETQMQIERADL